MYRPIPKVEALSGMEISFMEPLGLTENISVNWL